MERSYKYLNPEPNHSIRENPREQPIGIGEVYNSGAVVKMNLSSIVFGLVLVALLQIAKSESFDFEGDDMWESLKGVENEAVSNVSNITLIYLFYIPSD